MGYIYLNSPVSHILYLENNILSIFTGIDQVRLIKLIYSEGAGYIKNNEYSLAHLLFPLDYIQHKLGNFNLLHKISEQRSILINSTVLSKKQNCIKSLRLMKLFMINNINPEWLLLTVVPVLPAGLRPLLKLEDNNFVMSIINELYRNIIFRNNRIKRLRELRRRSAVYLELLERRNLQKVIDTLMSNNKDINNKPIFKIGSNFFKQFLLGKRVDFSGRSVIAAGPTLPYIYAGLPFKLGLKLFEYHLLRLIKKNKLMRNLLLIGEQVNRGDLIIKRLLTYLCSNEIILLNRAPTLHRMNIQAFKPHLIEGDAIKLFPLACTGFNADFDGDQMGIFLLSSTSALKEAKRHIIHDKNILHPSSFKNIFKYSQTIVLGLNTLLALKHRMKNHLVFNSINDVFSAYSHGLLDLNSLIILKQQNSTLFYQTVKKYVLISVGKLFLYCSL